MQVMDPNQYLLKNMVKMTNLLSWTTL